MKQSSSSPDSSRDWTRDRSVRRFVQEKVATGAFPSEEAVLQEAVRRFRQDEQVAAFGRRGNQASFEDLIDYEAIAS